MSRENNLIQWIKALYPERPFTFEFAAADADYRRYFRARFEGGSTLIGMDAPPEKTDLSLYIERQKLFAPILRVPEIYAYDLKNGFMLIEDFGDDTLIALIEKGATLSKQKEWLKKALDILLHLQQKSKPDALPLYSRAKLEEEMDLFRDWCAPLYLNHPLDGGELDTWEEIKRVIFAKITPQPLVYVHRDFIIRNLMLLKNKELGVIDFQDAVMGPITYDLACLTRDAFVVWEEEFTLDLVIYYWQRAKKAGLPVAAEFDAFYQDYEFMGAQRHLKVAGIFARLAYRDGKERYLREIPTFIRYLRQVSRRYRELKPLYQLLDAVAAPDPDRRAGYSF